MGFTKPNSGPLSDIEGFITLIPYTYSINKPNNITGIDKIHLKSDRIIGSIVH